MKINSVAVVQSTFLSVLMVPFLSVVLAVPSVVLTVVLTVVLFYFFGSSPT
jgi:hypothetical protein